MAAAGHVSLSYDGVFGPLSPRRSPSGGMLIEIGVALVALASAVRGGWLIEEMADNAAVARVPAPNDDFRVARGSIPQTPQQGGRYAREGRNT